MSVLIIGMLLFLGIHSVRIVAPAWREAQIEKQGAGRWKGIYSVISIIGLITLIYGYSLARENATQLFDPPLWGRHLLFGAMPISIFLITVADFKPGYVKRLVRHPMLLAVLIWAIAHLIANGDSASLVLFGGFLVWAAIDLVAAFNRPSVAIDQPMLWPDLASLVIAFVATVLIILYLHKWLIGVAIV